MIIVILSWISVLIISCKNDNDILEDKRVEIVKSVALHSANRPAVEKAPLMSSDITFVKSDITFVKSDITFIKPKNPLLQMCIIRTNKQILGKGYQKLYLLFEI